MSEITDMLDEFHGALGDERGRRNAELRMTLHEEEHRELIDALAEAHAHEAYSPLEPTCSLDEADVVYVAFGTAHAFAIDLDAALAEVHRAAMSKVDPKCVACGGSGIFAAPLGSCRCEDCLGTGKGNRVVREDGKILKPEGFIPPDMSKAVRS